MTDMSGSTKIWMAMGLMGETIVLVYATVDYFFNPVVAYYGVKQRKSDDPFTWAFLELAYAHLSLLIILGLPLFFFGRYLVARHRHAIAAKGIADNEENGSRS